MKIEELKEIAKGVRRDIIKMTGIAGSGHPGGSLSAVEIIVALYFYKMRYDPKNPEWEERDRFVLSKGHAAPALYSVLARAGFFSYETLWTLRRIGSMLQGHPSRIHTPGIEASTGSLGQGLSIANGMAISGKIYRKSYRVYVLLGDGEIEEGEVWEAAMSAHRFRLDNLCAILDNNDLQIDGTVKEIMDPYPMKDKWKAFGWEVMEVNGHDFSQIINALDEAEKVINRPTMIIAHTIKGKGVSYMEGRREWHGKAPHGEEIKRALKDLA